MSSTTRPGVLDDTARLASTGGPWPILTYQLYCELVKLLRLPMFILPTVLFPIMFFAFFGLPVVNREMNGVKVGPYLMASFGAYSMISVALFSFGASIAAERGLGWNRLLRTTPMRSWMLFSAKVVMAILFGLVTLLALFAFGILAGGVRMPLQRWGELTLSLLVGMAPFVALGLFIGYIAGPNSAAAIANLIFLPLSFASGLFVPLENLPTIVQRLAPYLPAYHTGQLGWIAVGAGDNKGVGVHLLWLVGYSLIFLALALFAYRRDEGKQFG